MFYDKMNTPIGILTISADENALVGIEFGDTGYKSVNTNEITKITKLQLEEYFEGKRKRFDIPISLKGSVFQVTVWNELLKIEYGKVCTYGEIAAAIGKPKASRAVGGANNKNPIPIIVPCHRVVAVDNIGGFGPGIGIKEFLLDLEKVTAVQK